jgi:hypothetical protein
MTKASKRGGKNLLLLDEEAFAAPAKSARKVQKASAVVSGHCLCGAVAIEIDVPAFWAWHDHARASRLAHGAAYATYVGCWRKHVRVTRGAEFVSQFEDKVHGGTRSFCSHCGTPLLYKRPRSPHMVNIPRALFATRTGREPRYHLGIEELQDWTYRGGPLVPLKGYPGVVWERPKAKKRGAREEAI